MVGLALGARMTVVRMPDGSLFLHSPVPPTPALRKELDALGPVAHIVMPNRYHHVYAPQMIAAYPKAMVHAAPGLEKKRPDVKIDATLGNTQHDGWGGALVPIFIEGCELAETVFVHPKSRSVISADLTENFQSCDHLATRLYLMAGGVYKKPGWSRFLRILYRDRDKARASIDKLLEHDFDRVILSHGETIATGGKDAVRSTFTFL
jgi:hypothetical protein